MSRTGDVDGVLGEDGHLILGAQWPPGDDPLSSQVRSESERANVAGTAAEGTTRPTWDPRPTICVPSTTPSRGSLFLRATLGQPAPVPAGPPVRGGERLSNAGV